MRKASLYFYLAVTMFLLALVQGVSGFVLWLAFPSGGGAVRRGAELVFGGVTKHSWIDVHDWVAVALLVLVVLHIYMHRKWIARMMTSSLQSARVAPVTEK